MNDPGKIPVKIALNTTIISDEICFFIKNDPGKIPVKIVLNTTIISDEICLYYLTNKIQC
jgi:hypothetical protein